MAAPRDTDAGSGEWVTWHTAYDDEQSPISRRLALVQRLFADALDRCPQGTVRVLSMCAGDGRDVIGVLASHRRAADVQARLIELDAELAGRAREQAARLRLRGVEVVTGDAADTAMYEDLLRAHVVLMCGVFGNITDDDVQWTVAAAPELCAADGTVIWTRGTFAPDLTPSIRGWFAAAGCDEIAWEPVPGTTASAGAVRVSKPQPYRGARVLFRFLPADERPSRRGTAAR